jgi:sugar phosphate isomerase/epimerase
MKLPLDRLSVNTFDKTTLQRARGLGLGLEVEEYLSTYTEEELSDRRERVSEMMSGFSRFSFHGTVVSRDFVGVSRISEEQLLPIYNASYQIARSHGIDKIVFHSFFLTALHTPSTWIARQAAFWKEFLKDKPTSIRVYIENFIDDTPDLLAELCDSIGDPRLRICLDVGHALANSSINLLDWVGQLGRRIGHVHLHNNDGIEDKHWPLGQGVLDMASVIESLLDQTEASTDLVLECNLEESLCWLRQNSLVMLP